MSLDRPNLLYLHLTIHDTDPWRILYGYPYRNIYLPCAWKLAHDNVIPHSFTTSVKPSLTTHTLNYCQTKFK